MDTFNIDFTKLQQAAIRKVTQTALCLGLGINTANNPTFREYQLSGITSLQFLPSDVDENTLADYKNFFFALDCRLRVPRAD
jgi:biotin-(acetyl-CoA carboxylase) ligase